MEIGDCRSIKVIRKEKIILLCAQSVIKPLLLFEAC